MRSHSVRIGLLTLLISGLARIALPASGVVAEPVVRNSPFQVDVPEKVRHWSRRANTTAQAYRLAEEHFELSTRTPCFCGCEVSNHGSLASCFRSSHGAYCIKCQQGIGLAIELRKEGRSREEIAAASRFRLAPTQDGSYTEDYLLACGACHRVPPPASRSVDEWESLLPRMSRYLQTRADVPSQQAFDTAIEYLLVRARSDDNPAIRQAEAELEASLQRARHRASYAHPGDSTPLDAEWFERVARAYSSALDCDPDALSAPCDCGHCEDPHRETHLTCLASGHALICESTVSHVETGCGSE